MKATTALRVTLFTALLTLPLAALARAPYTGAGSEQAVVRLSWRLSAPAREDCRPRTAEELAALPAHMRTPTVCEREVARYSLVTRIGGSAGGPAAPADTLALQGGGVTGDRPLFVLEEHRLPPGRHRVRVDLYRRAGGGPDRVATLDTVLALEAGRVRLITLDDAGRLRVRSR